MWCVYVLRSIHHPFLYVGSTNDLQRRLKEHNNGESRSTAPYKPYKIAVSIMYSDERQARTLEKYFKTGSGKTVLKKRILHDEDLAQHEVRSEA